MSENNHEELFKTTLMGGFDKDDVMTKVQNLKDQAYAAQKKLEAKIEEKEQEIEKLNRKIREREDKIEELEKNIHEKYQSYIDNYDSISGLVFEAQVKAKKLTQETEDACREKTEETDAACRKLTEETEESCRKLKEETEEACRRKTEETDESCRGKTEETDEACCKKREETNESCRKQREETKESCAKQRRETKEQCEYMVESARQKGEELAAVYEEKLQAEAEEIQSHMDAELQKANTRYQKIYAEMETMTSVLEKNRRIFEETFAGIENGKPYCGAQRATAEEKHPESVTVNGIKIELGADRSFTLAPAGGKQTAFAADKAGNNVTQITVTAAEESAPRMPGDVDGDGKITMADCLYLKRG